MELSGFLKLAYNYDPGDGLYIGDIIISKELEVLHNKNVTVSFYISNTEQSKDGLKENNILSIAGVLTANYGDCYSEYTGYLWTTDELMIGNHDLIEDLSSHSGKYCHLSIYVID